MTQKEDGKANELLKAMTKTMTRTMNKILATDDVDSAVDELLHDVLDMYKAGRVFIVYKQKGKVFTLDATAKGVTPFSSYIDDNFNWQDIWQKAV